MEEAIPLLEKSMDALTVRDTLKVTAIVTALSIAVPVAAICVLGAVGSAMDWKKNRKAAKPEFRLTAD